MAGMDEPKHSKWWKVEKTSRKETYLTFACINLIFAAILGAQWMANVGAPRTGYMALGWLAGSGLVFWRALRCAPDAK